MIEIKKWPPIGAENCVCSICKNQNVFYINVEEWAEHIHFKENVYLIHQCMIKKYCKECFEEYGGNEIEENE